MLCKKCGTEKSKDDFYGQNYSACKECTKAMVRANRARKLDYYQAYDRSRANRPDRVASRLEYQKTEAFKASRPAVLARYAHNHPGRQAANNAVSNAVRDGRLFRLPCQVCGVEKSEAHHPDYSNHLGVVWLCVDHHAQLHADHREYLRESATKEDHERI